MKLPLKPKIIYMYDPDYGNYPFPYMFAGIPDTLRQMNLEVSFLNSATATLESFRQTIEKFKPELLFGFIQDGSQVVKIASFLKEYHPVAAVNWYQEEPNSLLGGKGGNVLEASEHFDMWFGIDKKMVPFWKTKAVFLPPAFDQNIFQDEMIDRCFDVSYIGQLGPSYVTKMYWPYMKELARYGRKALICTERPMGLPLLPKPLERFIRSRKRHRFFQKLPLWRCVWKNPQDENEKSYFLNQSNIHFGLNRVRGIWEETVKEYLPNYPLDQFGLFYQLKSRPFQAVGAGAMVLNEYCEELEELFEIGKEIVTFAYGDLEEVRDKLAWYTSHDAEREKIARAGYERGRKQHTYVCRVNQILDKVRQEF